MRRFFKKMALIFVASAFIFASCENDSTGSGGSGSGGGEQGKEPSVSVNAKGTLTLKKAGGWFESAYIEWEPYQADSTYNVYVKSETVADWTKLDKELIRGYSNTAGGETLDYFRADALGLKAGSYKLKVEVAEEISKNLETDFITVTAHDRSGFAFSASSPLKTGSGAYNDDGTLKTGAQVVYVSNANAKTVTATVDGISCTGLQSILAAKEKGGTGILNIRILGTIYGANMDSFGSSAEGLQIKGKAARQNMNLTIEGVGEDAGIHGFGMLIRNCGNVELRNFAVMDAMDDSISVDTDNCNLWIHNIDLFYGQAGSAADQKKGDGTIDIKLSQYCTVSYNHYWDSGKASLLDASEKTSNYVDNITFHHNWFDHSDSRHPRIRNGQAFHIYNNYYDGNAKYGVASACGASVFVENNYFRNCKLPMITGQQGHDKQTNNKWTLTGDKGGIIKAYGNFISGGTITWYSESDTEFDAYDSPAKDTVLPDSLKSKSNIGYSNFDTATTMYSYTADSAEVAKTKAITYAGRMNGGDLSWEFAESEDTNDTVIPALKTAVQSYKSKTVKTYTSGNNTSSSGSSGGNSGNSGNNGGNTEGTTVTGSATYIPATDGKDGNSFFNVTSGSLGSASGTVNGTSYTQGLKMESATNIAFTTDKKMTLTVIFSDDSSNKNIKVDGTKISVTTNTLTKELEAGSHTITKADVATIIYFSLSE